MTYRIIIEQGTNVVEREIVGDVRLVLQAPALPPAPEPPPIPPAPQPLPEAVLISGDGLLRADTPYLEVKLHSHTAHQLAHGDQWSLPLDDALKSEPQMRLRFAAVQLADTVRLDPQCGEPLPEGGTSAPKGGWLGWAHGEPAVWRPYHERRLDMMLNWIDGRYAGIGRAARIVTGYSMGAWGGLVYGLRRPEKFGAVLVSRPRWRYSRDGHVNVNLQPGGEQVRLPAQTPPVEGYPGNVAEYLDMVAYVGSAERLPFVGWCCGRRDGYTPFSDQVAAAAALRSAGQPFVFVWNDGDHSGGDVLDARIRNTYTPQMFAPGAGMPLLIGSSRDADPNVDLEGSINEGFRWRNVVESANAWRCEISNVLGETAVTLQPHSRVFQHTVAAQRVTIPAGAWVSVAFASASDSEPPPAPQPAPPAPAPPPSAPPASAELLEVHTQALNPARIFCAASWSSGQRYDRFEVQEVERGMGRVPAHAVDFAGGGRLYEPAPGLYKLRVGDKIVSEVELVAGQRECVFEFALDGLAHGQHIAQIITPPSETSPRFNLVIDKGEAGYVQPTLFVSTGNYEVAKLGRDHQSVLLPLGTQPQPSPRTPRAPRPFAHAAAPGELYLEDMLPRRTGADRPSVMGNGIVTSAHQQTYSYSNITERIPDLPLLDGPRGIGTVSSPLHMQWTHRGGLRCLQNGRWCDVSADGTVRTVSGLRHSNPPSYYRDAQQFELVGIWDMARARPRGMRQPWDLSFLRSTLALSTNPADPLVGGDRVHARPVVGLVADTGNGRVLRHDFERDSLTAPPVVTELVAGLREPWSAQCHETEDVFVCNERLSHQITLRDAHTGQLIEVLLRGDPAAVGGTLAERRAQPCLAPEGGVLVGDWYSFASSLQRDLRRLNIKTRELQVLTNLPFTGNTKFYKLAVSRGDFGPPGAVFVSSWAIDSGGFPYAYLPDGTRWHYHMTGSAPLGRGGRWESLHYGSSCAVGPYGLAFGTAMEGIQIISLAQEADPPAVDLARYRAGREQYTALGLGLIHGANGFGFHSFARPWGRSAEIDYYLTAHGHRA